MSQQVTQNVASTIQVILTLNNVPVTGLTFSDVTANLRKAAREFRVGNLYLNRGITGALVSRQPFGGFRLSGTASKAGGRDYLQLFMEPGALRRTRSAAAGRPSPINVQPERMDFGRPDKA